uniref:Uncharacterized protein n=1 Tax=Romanomermis culicivorax TaxID=13658 RepID=A0A915IWT7_ROMCU
MEEEASSTDNEPKIGQNVHLSLKLYNDIKQKKSLFRISMKCLQHNLTLVSKLRTLVEDLKSRIQSAQNDVPESVAADSDQIIRLKRKFHDKRRKLRQTEVIIRELFRRHYVLIVEIASLEKRRRKWSSQNLHSKYSANDDDDSDKPGRSPSTPPNLMVALRRSDKESSQEKMPTLVKVTIFWN